MNEIRKAKLESLIQREVSEILIKRRIKDERIGFISVTRIHLLPDMSEMTVFVSLFGSDDENKETWHALLDNAKLIQSTVSRNLRLRVTPHLVFQRDSSISEGDHILEMLDKEKSRPGSDLDT